MRVGTSLQIELARQIGALRLGRRFEAESGGSGGHVGRVLRPVALLLWSSELFLGDQVVDALLVDHLPLCFRII